MYCYQCIVSLLLLLSVFKLTIVGQVNVNHHFDTFLQDVCATLKAKNHDKIPLPDIHRSFEKPLFMGIKVNGEFHAKNGIFEDAASLFRTGDVTIEKKHNKQIFIINTGLKKLHFHYRNYSFKLLAIDAKGALHASCSKNSIIVEISLLYDGVRCNANLERAQFVTLGGFLITQQGNGPLNDISALIFTWLLNTFNEKVRSLVNDHVENALREELKKHDLCKVLL